MENHHRNSGFSHEKWWFSIAMLNYQRVNLHFPMGFPMFSHFPMGFPHQSVLIMWSPWEKCPMFRSVPGWTALMDRRACHECAGAGGWLGTPWVFCLRESRARLKFFWWDITPIYEIYIYISIYLYYIYMIYIISNILMLTNDGEMRGWWMLTTWNIIGILESTQWNKIIAIYWNMACYDHWGHFSKNWNITASEKG